MKTVLWVSFYFVSFMVLIVAMYVSKEQIVEKTEGVPVLNYTKYHRDAVVEDSTYSETIDSLAVVVEGLLTQLTEYVSQLQDRDHKIHSQGAELETLREQLQKLQAASKSHEQEKVDYSRQQDDKKLVDMAKMVGTMKPDVLSPILNSLSDRMVQIFYDKAKPKDRVKIFNALPPDRAGKILTRIAEN